MHGFINIGVSKLLNMFKHAPRVAWRSNKNVKIGSGFGWTSSNWSGYAITKTDSDFNSVSGQWIVPTVRPSSNNAYSSAWVGIDGFNNDSLIQTGTAHDSINGSASYYAWWEILPAAATRIPHPVSPGDRMRAEINHIGGSMWSIMLINDTKGWTFRTVRPYSGPRESAEWIVEAPSINGQITRLANYGKVAFSRAEVNGGNPNLTKSNGGVMIQDNVQVSTPSAPNKSRNGFVVSYGSSKPKSAAAGKKTKKLPRKK